MQQIQRVPWQKNKQKNCVDNGELTNSMAELKSKLTLGMLW